MTEPDRIHMQSLVSDLKRGNIDVLDEIIDIYTSKLYYYTLSILKNDADAEEIIQDTFVKVYKKIETYDTSTNFSAWIYMIASNTAKDYLRKRKRHSVCISYDQQKNEDDGNKDTRTDIQDHRNTPDKDLQSKEVNSIIDEQISLLPDIYKEVILLRHIDDLSYDEIALTLNCKVGTVKSRLARAREILKENINLRKE